MGVKFPREAVVTVHVETYCLTDYYDEPSIFISVCNNSYYTLHVPKSQLACCVGTCVSIFCRHVILRSEANPCRKLQVL